MFWLRTESGFTRSGLLNSSLTSPDPSLMRGSYILLWDSLKYSHSSKQMLWGCSLKIPGSLLSPYITAMFHSVMFIHGSFCYSAIAAAGKGSSLLRVFSILQKLLLSQRRDSRLNNHFSSWWQCETAVWIWRHASNCLSRFETEKEKREAIREGGMKVKFPWFRFHKDFGVDLINRLADVHAEIYA